MYSVPPVFTYLRLPAFLAATLAIVALELATVTTAVAAVKTADTACMKKAVDERSKQIQKAYKDYSDDMVEASKRLQEDENDKLEYGDIAYRQSETQRVFQNYTYEISERSRDLSSKLTDAWNVYAKSRTACNASAIPESVTPTYMPPNYGAPSYGTYPSYGSYPYGNNPYGSGYPYSYRQNPYDEVDYDAYDRYRRGDGYYYHGAAACQSRPLAPPPPGCGYQYGTDSQGCPSYTPVCNNALSQTTPCTCSNQFAPVCGRDGRTYFNACYALCLGGTVQYEGSCYQY